MLTHGASLDGQLEQRDSLGLRDPRGKTLKTVLRKQIPPSAGKLRLSEPRRPVGTQILPLASWEAWGGGLNLM